MLSYNKSHGNGSNGNEQKSLFDVVALAVDLPDENLWRGQVGTVVEILANGAAFEVEFSDRAGRTYESIGLRPDQIMLLHFAPVNGEIPGVLEPV